MISARDSRRATIATISALVSSSVTWHLVLLSLPAKERPMRRLTHQAVVLWYFWASSGSRASAQQQVNVFVGGFRPLGADAPRPLGRRAVRTISISCRSTSAISAASRSAPSSSPVSATTSTPASASATTSEPCTVYTDFVNANGTEIEQDLRLRIVPFTATVRFLPLGHTRRRAVRRRRRRHLQLALQRERAIPRHRRLDLPRTPSTAAAPRGPVVLGGVRVPIGSWGVGGEVR